MHENGDVLSENVTFFAAPRGLALSRVPIVQRWDFDEKGEAVLVVESAGFHFGVCLELEGTAVRWSDDFFHLHPGEACRIRTGLRLADVEPQVDGVIVYSLADSYE